MSDLDAIKQLTGALHSRAERSGIVADIIAGCASRYGVALLLRNLLPIYQLLDTGPFGDPLLARSAAIEADLRLLAPGQKLPLLQAGAAYAARVASAGEGLVAHAYVRYLGDLNGGRVLRRRLAMSLGDVAAGISFHQFPDLHDHDGFKSCYRQRLDQAVRHAPFDAVAGEAIAAFEMNIALSDAVRAFAEAGLPPPPADGYSGSNRYILPSN